MLVREHANSTEYVRATVMSSDETQLSDIQILKIQSTTVPHPISWGARGTIDKEVWRWRFTELCAHCRFARHAGATLLSRRR